MEPTRTEKGIEVFFCEKVKYGNESQSESERSLPAKKEVVTVEKVKVEMRERVNVKEAYLQR